MNIGVIGTGYVGLVTAVGLAELGHNVIGTDKDEDKINKASQGVVPIYEPGLDRLLKTNLEKGNLTFSHDLPETIRRSEVIFVCVNTPPRKDGSADMSYVEGVSRKIAENLNSYKLVVEKSTVPVRTSMWIKRTLSLYRKGSSEYDVASNPEFLREGCAVHDFLNPDRVVIGVESEKARGIMQKIYQKYNDRVHITNIDTAELIKHASNSFLAMKISFINLMSELCERTEADVEKVAEGMGLDKRIGKQFLRAGIGYGGSCFPKDVRALIRIGEDLGVEMDLLRSVEKINQDRIRFVVNKVKNALWILKDKTIAVLGLSFKPETDDIRNAPSLNIIRELLNEDAVLRLYDPKAADNIKSVFPPRDRVVYCHSLYQALEGANAAVLVTEWEEFGRMDFQKAKALMENPIFIDGRNVFDPQKIRAAGFEYTSIGRK
ncbi:MAG: UDP-glucose/GDP-mannose dehydrogenase family protein [Candidatus Aminicenantes bacterium]